MIQYVDYDPDILHCNDWQAAMVPVYLNLFYREIEKYQKIRTVFVQCRVALRVIADRVDPVQDADQFSLMVAEQTVQTMREPRIGDLIGCGFGCIPDALQERAMRPCSDGFPALRHFADRS